MLERFSRDVAVRDVSWRSLVAVAVLLGGVWRNVALPPENAVSFIPVIVPSFQAASIILSVVVWFRFGYQYRSYVLFFLPWLTVALSVNVPFDGLIPLAFGAFCFGGVGIVVARIYFPYSSELRKTFKHSRYRNRVIYAYPIFLTLVGFMVFLGLVRGVELGDDIFMRYIRDYAVKRSWGFFDGPLSLNGSVSGMQDVRPIIEVERNGADSLYLAGQIFEEYRNGVWQTVQQKTIRELPRQSEDAAEERNLILFEHLGGVIPVPRGVVAMSCSGGTYEQDQNGLVFSTGRHRFPKADVFTGGRLLLSSVSRDTDPSLTELSPLLREHLPSRVRAIVGDQKDAYRTARIIEKYFKENFSYDLSVKFRADDRGMLYMLDRKPAAYCAIFASAMTLMLRERGIPSRIVGGFLATEVSGRRRDRFLVRGRDAHAWVEALLPVRNKQNGQNVLGVDGQPLRYWRAFDPTPPDSRMHALSRSGDINRVADWVWCSQKRLKVALIGMETKTLVNILFIVILVVALEEIGKKFFPRFFKRRRGSGGRGSNWLSAARNPYDRIIKRFDACLKKRFKVVRNKNETDGEFVERLRVQQGVPSQIILAMKEFVVCYHSARFGNQPHPRLEALVEVIEGRSLLVSNKRQATGDRKK